MTDRSPTPAGPRVFSFQSAQPVFAILIPAHVSVAAGVAQIENGDARASLMEQKNPESVQPQCATPLINSQPIIPVVVFHAAGGEQEHQLVVEGEECEG